MDTGDFRGFNVSMRDQGIAWFQFTTPERLNGMTMTIKRDLVEAVTQAQMDNAVRVLVFTGSGRAFCAGDDLKGYRGAEIPGSPLVPDIVHGHDSGIGTYNGLRTISQRVKHRHTRARQAHHRRRQRRGHPDRILPGALLRLPDRCTRCAHGQRDATLRAVAG